MIENEVIIAAHNAKLSATYCFPEEIGAFPTVLMVHGSGAIDRNENHKHHKLDVFNSFAHHLAENGIASLRYDKRGIGESTGNYYSAGHFDLVEDAMCCFENLLQNESCDNDALFLLGHSEGSLIVPQMSQKDIKVSGIIMLTPFIDTMESIMYKQSLSSEKEIKEARGLKGFLIRLFTLIFDPVKIYKRFVNDAKNTSKEISTILFKKMPTKWLREMISLDPADIHAHTTCPALVIGGAKDLQCEPDDVAKISQIIGGPVDSYLIDDMTHILRKDFDDPSIFNYSKLMKKPVEPEVLTLVSEWIKKRKKLNEE